MKFHAILLIFAILFSLLGISSASELESYQATYQKGVKSIQATHAKNIAELSDLYLNTLKKHLDKFQGEGDLDNTILLKNEIKRFKEDKAVSQSTPSHSQLINKLRTIYKKQAFKYDVEHNRKIVAYTQKYDQALDTLQKQLVIKNKLEEAKAVRLERSVALTSEPYLSAKNNNSPASQQTTHPRKIPKDAQRYGGHYYKFYKGIQTWEEAKQLCEDMGGYLVCITSQEENDFVGELAGNHNVWIGATDEKREGDWRWVSGEPFRYSNWLDGEPNNAGTGNNEDHLSRGYGKKWLDIHNSNPDQNRGFVCEWNTNNASPQTTTHPRNAPKDAQRHEGHYYKFYKGLHTWEEAKQLCEDMGGYLVCITSQKENDFVGEIAGNHNIWLGATDEKREGDWRWVSGELFRYSNWLDGKPNNHDNNEDHLSMWHHNKKWIDVKNHAYQDLGFVCEWNK